MERTDIIKAACALEHPMEGKFAVRLWELCSGNNSGLQSDTAAKVYRDCGYIPFSGYPLARSGHFCRMTRDQVMGEIDANPVIQEWR